MSVPLAHAGHWLMGIGFAGAPLTVIGGDRRAGLRERRRDAEPQPGLAAAGRPPARPALVASPPAGEREVVGRQARVDRLRAGVGPS